MASSPEIPPPFDDQPPAVPDAPEPIKESSGQAMRGLALNARSALLKSLSRIQQHRPTQATDAVGRSFLVLATPNVPISQLVETAIPGAPWSVAIFTDEDENDRWLPAPASLLANDGAFWFAPFQPTLDGTPLSLIDTDTAQVIPVGGIQTFLRIAWEIDDSRPLVPDEPVYAVRVTAVEVLVQAYGDDPPADDFNAGVTYRPWFTIGPAVDGVRPVDYQTLGYAHFWLFVKMLVEEPPPSYSSDGSSDSSSPPAHQACFGIIKNRQRIFPTWGMILFPMPLFRMSFSVRLGPGEQNAQVALPPEWIGSVRPGTSWVVCTTPHRHGRTPVLARIHEHSLHVACLEPEKFVRKVTVQIAGLMDGGPTEPQYTDDAGRAHNQKFWRTIP